MKIAIIQFPGSNCEAESIRAIRAVGMDAEEFLWNRDPRDLASFDGYFIVGGFSYEDRSRAGVIASLDPIMRFLRPENEKAKPILGVCNGAQILVESGFVPGLANYQPAMALATNKRIKNGHVLGTGYYNAWVHMKLAAEASANAFTKKIPKDFTMRIPVAHGEGRFIIPDSLLQEITTKNLATFQYCDTEGKVLDEFPVNPNGSVHTLAGVSNGAGNVLAIMPHPERTSQGQPLFESMREYLAEKKVIQTSGSLTYQAPEAPFVHYEISLNTTELIVESIITDNEAMTVDLTLKHLGIPVQIKRKRHWEIVLRDENIKENIVHHIKDSAELFNPRKEKVVTANEITHSANNSLTILIRYKDDIVGEEKTQILKERYHIDGIQKIRSGTLWTITPLDGSDTESIQQALQTHIFSNQYSQECFIYVAN